MAIQQDSVTVQVELPREEYERLAARARQEHLSVSQVIPLLVNSELRRREKARRLMMEASRSYRARMRKESKLDLTTEEIFAELRAIREEVANELFPS
jgi:hypothetical protein